MTKYIIMRERRRRKGKKGEARGTFWTVELKVPKMIDRLKKPISLYGMPPYMNEQEAETVARALGNPQEQPVGLQFRDGTTEALQKAIVGGQAVNALIQRSGPDLDIEAVGEVSAAIADSFMRHIAGAVPRKQRRKRRTKEEIEEDLARAQEEANARKKQGKGNAGK